MNIKEASRRLVAFVGPSGSGKDTLQAKLMGLLLTSDIDVHIVTRQITREQDQTEKFNSITTSDFDQMVENGTFCIHWEIYGNKYGIPRSEIDPYLQSGYLVFVNLSRAKLTEFKEIYPSSKVIVVDVSKKLAVDRIKLRKRDTGKNLEARINRLSQKIDMPIPDIYIRNEGKIEIVLSILLESLKRLVL